MKKCSILVFLVFITMSVQVWAEETPFANNPFTPISSETPAVTLDANSIGEAPVTNDTPATPETTPTIETVSKPPKIPTILDPKILSRLRDLERDSESQQGTIRSLQAATDSMAKEAIKFMYKTRVGFGDLSRSIWTAKSGLASLANTVSGLEKRFSSFQNTTENHLGKLDDQISDIKASQLFWVILLGIFIILTFFKLAGVSRHIRKLQELAGTRTPTSTAGTASPAAPAAPPPSTP